MSFITAKFHEILFSGFSGDALTYCFNSIFHFGQISKLKNGITPRKKLNQNFLWICTSTWYVLHNYKVSRNSVERFQSSCADKKNRTDGLTDRLTAGSKTLYPPELVAWGINMVQTVRTINVQVFSMVGTVVSGPKSQLFMIADLQLMPVLK